MSRVKELYKVIKDANEELEQIRKICKHEEHTECNYMWAPGHISVGHTCDYCGYYLGKYQIFTDWLERIKSYIECEYGETDVNAKGELYMYRAYKSYWEKYTVEPNGLKIRLDIYNNPEKYNEFEDKILSEKEFDNIIKKYLI